ncbi:MAG: arylsulfatase [Tannerellaceae bacterium]|jgi:arylsulfatase A-like enzyme|nr:arylsulfatase [Tannerellaceae bacterium]
MKHLKQESKVILSNCIMFCGIFMQTIHAQNEQPNIIVIMADDQGWGDLSFNNNQSVCTPNIDRIAKEGVHFTNFYVCPVSSPSRAEFLTGRYAARGGVSDVSRGGERLNLNEITIADYLKQAGYATAAFGKWHNGTQYPYHPNARGFDTFFGFCSGHWGNYWNPMLEYNGEIVEGKGFIIDELTNKAINYIKKNKNNPFFVFIPFNTPHSPMQIPDKWWNKVKDRPIRQQGDKEDTSFTKAALALTENIDWNVGRIMNSIQQLGIENKTIIIYLSDNGPNSNRWNGDMKGIKGSTDEGGVKSPLFIKWPDKIKNAKSIEQLSGIVDLMPTLLDLTGIKIEYKNRIDGISLKEFLIERHPTIERTLFSHWNQKTAVRTQDYLLNSEDKLFNTSKDRSQQIDLTDQHKEIFDKLKSLKEMYKTEILSELQNKDTRPFIIAHPDERFSKLPARDGIPYGNIQRSNKYPNSSYFINWIDTSDSISWNVKVEEPGTFEAMIYYICTHENIGSTLRLSVGNSELTSQLTKVNDTPMLGAELDRVPRTESYSKGFKPYSLGTIILEKGEMSVSLKALQIPGEEVMYLQMLVFRRIN